MGKLGLRFIVPFQVMARVGKVTYRLVMPKELRQIQKTFHVSQPQKCMANNSVVVPLDDI